MLPQEPAESFLYLHYMNLGNLIVFRERRAELYVQERSEATRWEALYDVVMASVPR
jgi:hypothetical protein